MVQLTYPGVYIEEIPSGVHTITGVATSIAAFIGSFTRGPLNAPVRLLSMADFQRNFGGLDRISETSYAIQQFFANGGQECWVVRVADTSATSPAQAAKMDIPDEAGSATALSLRAGRSIDGVTVEDVGSWGNSLRIEIDYDTPDPSKLFNLFVSEVSADGTSILRGETYRNLTTKPNEPNYVKDVVNQGSVMIQVVNDPSETVRPMGSGTLGDLLPALPVVTDFPAPPNNGLTISVSGLHPSVTIPTLTTTITVNPANRNYLALRQLLESAIRSTSTNNAVPNNLKPLLANARVQLLGDPASANARFSVRLGRLRSEQPLAKITLGGDAASKSAVKLNASANTAQYKPDPAGAGAGADGPGAAAGTTFRPVPGTFFVGTAVPKTGMQALDKVDLFNILAIPEAATMSDADMQALYAAAEVYVEGRRAMLIVDIQSKVDRLDAMHAWLLDNSVLRHPNAAVYFPRVVIPDPLNQNRPRTIGGSGAVAGLYARTDAQRGVWKAPAGTETALRNVASLQVALTDPEHGTLNPLGINCLRSFPIYGNVIWGARTLVGADQMASDWKYVPIRRLTLFLEESLYRGTKWVVFEPNDEPLWSQIRMNVGAFMQDLFRKEAFQGTTPDQAFFVKCDAETTTQQDIDLGIVNIEVGYAPLKPAEFVVLKIRQQAPAPEV